MTEPRVTPERCRELADSYRGLGVNENKVASLLDALAAIEDLRRDISIAVSGGISRDHLRVPLLRRILAALDGKDRSR